MINIPAFSRYKASSPIFFVVILLTVAISVLLLKTANMTKPSKATNDNAMSLQFLLSSASVSKGDNLTATIKVKALSNTRIIGYVGDISFEQSKLVLQDIQYKLGVVSKDLGQDSASKSAINSTGKIHFQGEIQSSMGHILDTNETAEVLVLTFSVLESGAPQLSIGSNRWYKINPDNTLSEIALQDVVASTPPISSSSSLSSEGTSSASVSFQVKFQGVSSTMQDIRIPVKLKIAGAGQGSTSTQHQIVELVASNSGMFVGKATVLLPSSPSGKYALLIKGPKHVQRKLCDIAAIDTEQKLYSCTNPNLDMAQLNNTLLFPNVYLFSGDLPLASGQKGLVSAAVDVGTIRAIILEGKGSLPDSIAKADVNYDGVVDSQDYSLVIKTLEMGMIKDEE